MMQAIQESNEHLAKALQAGQDAGDKIDKEAWMYIESEMARTKAYQSMAYALLAVAEAIRKAKGE